MHMITSTACRPYAPVDPEPVECSNFEVHDCKDKALGAWALDWAAGSSDWWMTMGKWKLCVRWSDCRGSPSSISLACFKQEEYRPSWCLFPFRMATVLPLRTAWKADIFSQASLRNVERQRCWKLGSGDGQRLGDYFTARLSDLSTPLTSEVRRSPEPSARPSAAADSEERQICTTCLFAESVGLCLCFLPSCAMYKDNALETW